LEGDGGEGVRWGTIITVPGEKRAEGSWEAKASRVRKGGKVDGGMYRRSMTARLLGTILF